MRSAAKPIQAQPLARAREDLDDRDLAIASASHLADEQQLEAVRASRQAPATEDDLECGPVEGSKLNAQLLGQARGDARALSRERLAVRGLPAAEHPCQQAMLAEVAELAETAEIPTAVDGCGVVTFALPLERMATRFRRRRRAGSRAAAMRAHPELIRGGRLPTRRSCRRSPAGPRRAAPRALCAAGPDGLGIALKAEDGQQRALQPALAVLSRRLGLDGSRLRPSPVRNSRDEVVGSVTIC